MLKILKILTLYLEIDRKKNGESNFFKSNPIFSPFSAQMSPSNFQSNFLCVDFIDNFRCKRHRQKSDEKSDEKLDDASLSTGGNIG